MDIFCSTVLILNDIIVWNDIGIKPHHVYKMSSHTYSTNIIFSLSVIGYVLFTNILKIG